VRELAADYYKRIEARNPELNAYLTLSQERAFAQADRMDALVAAGKPLRRLRACLSRSRTSSVRAACALPAARRFWRITFLRMMRLRWSG